MFSRSFFAPPDELSAAELAVMFHLYFLGSSEGLLFDVAAGSFPALWDPLGEHLRGLGGHIRLRTAVESISHAGPREFAAHLDGGERLSADAVVLALLLRLRAGGRGLADLLHAQAEAQSEQVRTRRQVEADRAKPRTTVRCLIAIVAVMLAGLFTFAGHYLTPFSTLTGQFVLAVLTAIGAGAVAWMHRLTAPPTAERVLISTRREEVQAR